MYSFPNKSQCLCQSAWYWFPTLLLISLWICSRIYNPKAKQVIFYTAYVIRLDCNHLKNSVYSKIMTRKQVQFSHAAQHNIKYDVTRSFCESKTHFTTTAVLFMTHVTLEHKTSLKLLGYVCSNSQKYTVWVKIIYFSFMPKIIRILRKNYVPWRYLVIFVP